MKLRRSWSLAVGRNVAVGFQASHNDDGMLGSTDLGSRVRFLSSSDAFLNIFEVEFGDRLAF